MHDPFDNPEIAAAPLPCGGCRVQVAVDPRFHRNLEAPRPFSWRGVCIFGSGMNPERGSWFGPGRTAWHGGGPRRRSRKAPSRSGRASFRCNRRSHV